MIYEKSSFIIFPGYDHVFQYLLKDLDNENNCRVIEHLFINRKIEKLWESILKHPTVNEKIGEIIATITAGCLFLPDKIENNQIFIFSNIAIQYIPVSTLKRIKNAGAKLVLYFLDDLANRNSRIAFEKTKKIAFDAVCTFDRANADTYGFHYMNSMYSALVKKNPTVKYDACFIGSDKGRFTIVENIYKKMAEKNGTFFCSVYQTDERYKQKYKNMRINESIDYKDVAAIVQESNCIIDIVIGKQTGLSLRAYEALAYNKKLLTNNKSILSFPQYDERYMRYFETIEDIDWQFVLQRDTVDYGYKGEYSPVGFLKKVCEFL